MSKKNKNKKQKNLSPLNKIKNFFFPKDFGAEIARGMYISSPYGCSGIIGGGLYKLGKLMRKIIDPKHQMFGQGKEKNEE